MKRYLLPVLMIIFLNNTNAQKIELQPVQGQMVCVVQVPGLNRQTFALGVPETIGSSEGMILNFPEVSIAWNGPEPDGSVSHVWVSPGRIEYSLKLIPYNDCVDIEMKIKNLSRGNWTNVYSFNCLNPVNAKSFQDWTLERTYMSKNGAAFRMDGTTRINTGQMKTVQFYLNNDYYQVSPFVNGFGAISPDRTDDSYIVTMSDDGGSYMAATSPKSLFLFNNLDRCCIHSATDFGDIPSGEEKTVTSRFYLAKGALDDFLKRFESEVKNVTEPRVAMCWSKPWELADTSQWNFVYNSIDIFKFYIGSIDLAALPRLNRDSVKQFVTALMKKDIKIAIELGGLLDWHAAKGDKSGEASFQQDWANLQEFIKLIKEIDPDRNIDILDMDGPIRRMLFPNNKKENYHTIESAVNELFEVVKWWKDSIPTIEINLLTNFPNWAWDDTPAYFKISGEENGYGHYLDVLNAVKAKSLETGINLDGLTIDNPYDYTIGRAQTNQPDAIKDVDWVQRIDELVDVAREMGLIVNMIFNTNGARAAQGYSEQTLAHIDLYHQRIGAPDGYWIQSWYNLPDKWLPEGEDYTMTNLVKQAINKLNNIAAFSALPITEMGRSVYNGFTGGLYPDGSNFRPLEHNEAGLAISETVMPLDSEGNPSDNGKIVLLSIGMSNTSQEFSVFEKLLDTFSLKNPYIVSVNGAQGGQTATIIKNPDAQFWNIIETQKLPSKQVSANQVQVVWLKQANHITIKDFPEYADSLKEDLKKIVQILLQKYPYLKLVYISSRTYGGYATTQLNPEPYAYESGFSVKWLIQEQIEGASDLNYRGDERKAPWLSWGPYLWADGVNPRKDSLTWLITDFESDGTHPSNSGRAKVADLLLDFLSADETSAPWFLGQPNSIQDISANNNLFIISPNPASEYLEINLKYPTLEGDERGRSEIKIYNTFGECVMLVRAYSDTPLQRIVISHLPVGLYYCTLNTGKERITKSFVVIR